MCRTVRGKKEKGSALEISGVSKNKISYQALCIINARSFYIRSGTYLCPCPCQSSGVTAGGLDPVCRKHPVHQREAGGVEILSSREIHAVMF